MSHFLPVNLPVGRKSRVWLSRHPDAGAILFVHGFGGDPLDTWDRFPSLLPGDPACLGHDLYFYGYDSLKRQVAYSAAELSAFLVDLFEKPADVIASASRHVADKRPPGFSYKRVVVVCHSLGALIARRALLDIARRSGVRPHLGNVRIVLFAPAHLGARDVVEMAKEVLGIIKLKVLATSLQFKWTVLDDLKIGSDALELLLTDTEAEYLASKDVGGTTRHVVAEIVVHAEFDTIVVQNTFHEDPQLTRAPGQSHSSVCKPSGGYLDPLHHVLSQL